MNEQTRAELERLKQRQSQLQTELSVLAGALQSLESRLRAEVPAAPAPPRIVVKLPEPAAAKPEPPVAPTQSQPEFRAPPRIAPVGGQIPTPAALSGESVGTPGAGPGSTQSVKPAPALHLEPRPEKFLKHTCAYCGGHIEFPANILGQTILCPHCKQSVRLLAAPGEPPAPPRLPASAPGPAPRPKASFEMRLGTYWLVRVGMVMLLTGLVFFGNYAYQNFIGKLGPAGKVSLLYLASGILLGAGAWWQRKAAIAALKNYAQVLFAGGLAAVYFTTYAAYHLVNLRVIESALLDGALLLAWAGFMVWMADRKKSEVLALFAVGLAYYTSVITRVGSFTLYSNLVLTVAAVFFLVRNRWAGLTFASLVATYAAYAFWRFFDGRNWHWASPEAALWHGLYFLVCYWAVFGAAVFLSKAGQFRGANRATFLTLNNGAFFALFLLTMLQTHQGGFWKFCLGYGAALLALAAAAKRVLADEPPAKNAYLTQGLLLVTVGLVARFSGLQLALLLAAESVVLFTLGVGRKSRILQIGAGICGVMAVGWSVAGLGRDDVRKLWVGATVGAMMAFNAFWSHRRTTKGKAWVRPVPGFFTILALIGWIATTWYNTSTANFPLALAIEALVLTLSIYALGIPEFALFGQGCLVMAQGAWLIHFLEPAVSAPWWNPAMMIAVTLALSHWWPRQKIVDGGAQLNAFWQGLYALALIGVLFVWLNPLFGASTWLMLTSLLAIGLTAYGLFTRAWWLAAGAQIFLWVSAWQFCLQLLNQKPDWYFPLTPIFALVLLSAASANWFRRRPDAADNVRRSVLQIALIYRWVALAMSLWWVQAYLPAREQIWFLALLGLLAFAFAGWRKRTEALLFSAAFSACALIRFWLPMHAATTVYGPNLLAILALLGQQRAAKKLPGRFPLDGRVHGVVIGLGAFSLWLLLYRWLSESASSFYLTAAWSALALALFTCGMLLRERVYRWAGLGILATALGRVFLFDVWKLETLYRILSFMALGVVLLVLDFIYNKYQEKIKEWL